MVRYFYLWTPVVIVFGTAIILTIPYLAVIVFLVVTLVALAALAWAIVAVPYRLGHSVTRHWHGRSGARDSAALRKEALL
jgi:hypothetical protein